MADGSCTRVVQIVETLERRYPAAATALSAAGVEDPLLSVTVLAGPGLSSGASWWGDAAADSCEAVELVPDLVRSVAPIRDLVAVRWLTRRLRDLEPDVVHTYGSKAGVLGRLAAWRAGVPIVHSLDSHELRALAATQVNRWHPIGTRLVVARLLAARSQRLLVAGRADSDVVDQLRIGSEDQRRLVRNGVVLPDPAELARRRRQLRTDLGLVGRLVIGAVDCFETASDPRMLIQAFWLASLPHATLILAGTGNRRSAIERQVAELVARDASLDIRVLDSFSGVFGGTANEIDGAVPNDVALLSAAFDVSVQTSRIDGLSQGALEAAACGVPIVAPRCGSVEDLLTDGESAILAPGDDPAGLSRALVELAENPDQRRDLGRQAQQRSRPFALDRTRGDLLQLWREAASPSYAEPTLDEPALDVHVADEGRPVGHVADEGRPVAPVLGDSQPEASIRRQAASRQQASP